ncbi:bifunctional serine/threonine-protein kinase/formylglycine-generating enzyme family protein [Marinicella marina]|uniref:bifunctional serine/threonine-protein kinase/formylglycine-generating enzyme family protein n=1 Tax=Marinicella marina TaxID=2996016 RepID=UPI00226084B1|nr:bifunctional serine/threonine-protein kinase/formylglycine-generating enzyme family protein [Marinicella marina]MDJ1140836.1 bifunctional serine/threonine-protein kinase/formylglycine-generating enzyme family protein [Marinicella marina]
MNIPDHTILDKIGEGGMSAVYLGRQISLQRKVAIKVLKKLVMEDKSLAERFVDEAKTVASLDHPHIISIYEAKKLPSGLAYFTMPYLTHGDFGEIICTNSDHLIELLCQICDGLSHAHKHGIIHRDLKPDNILFDQFGRIKIADFGIAISKNTQRKTKETQLLGSAHYMSPEQIQSRDIDRHSDIYSLGCIIYEKLTGDHVYEAGNDFSILMSHINKPIPTLPDALQEWQPIIDKCLAKDPDERFSSVESLKDALLAIKYTQPAVAEKPIEPVPTKQRNQTGSKPPWFWPSVASVGLVVVMATLFLVTRDDNNIDATEKLQPITAVEPVTQAKKPQDTQPLTLDVGVVTQSEDEAELVDLSGNMDNETINEMSLEVKLEEAQKLLRSYRLTKPKGENAADKFQAILLEQPENQAAKNGLNSVGRYYFNLIENKIEENDFAAATKHIISLAQYLDEYDIDRNQFSQSVSDIMTTTNRLVTQAVKQRRPETMADNYLSMSKLLATNDDNLEKLAKAYQNIPQSGQVFVDQMGHQFVYFTGNTPQNDFMIGSNEVTVEQFKRFAGERFTEDKCNHYDKKVFFKKTWLKPPFEQGNTHPVVCITANNAQAYAQWLSEQTGANYRLPTQQEFVYLSQRMQLKNDCGAANLAGQETNDERKATKTKLNCKDGYVFTAPVETFGTQLNVADIKGNVSEWVSPCSGQSVCAMGSSWLSGSNESHTVALSDDPSQTYSHVGFRLVKVL